MSNKTSPEYRAYLKQKKNDRISKFREQPCMDCGDTDALITFDHIRGEKVSNVCSMAGKPYTTYTKLVAEIKKCDPVCRSCHDIREFRRGRFALKPIKSNIYALAEMLRQELKNEEDFTIDPNGCRQPT